MQTRSSSLSNLRPNFLGMNFVGNGEVIELKPHAVATTLVLAGKRFESCVDIATPTRRGGTLFQ
jgi:hypothetical protein